MKNTELPVWNLDVFYRGFDSAEYKDDIKKLENKIGMLLELVENFDAGKSSTFKDFLEETIALYNDTGALSEELFSYVYCSYSTNTADSKAQRELGKLEGLSGKFTKFRAAFRNILADNKELLDATVKEGGELGRFTFFFSEELEFQKKQMPVEQEALAAELSVSGADSWSKLQEAVTSSASADFNGESKTLTELRALAYSPDAAVRETAWKAEVELCRTIEIPGAFALNGVKGFCNTVNGRRGWKSTLEKSTAQARISGATLEALIETMTESLPILRKYMRLKAGLLGRKKLPFFDLFAPLGEEGDGSWSYDDAAAFIIEKFSAFSKELGDFAARAFEEGWLDARPRRGKVGGAYCTSFHKSGTSRILCNFDNSFAALSTMAHELGHAYHNEILKDAPEIYRDYPMTLAETASIFCETIVLEGALESCSESEKLALIEHELMESTQIVVDILSRYLFEKDVFEKRAEGDLSADEYCSLMLDAQRRTYGDAMDENFMHPYMWLVKGHYYRPELGFYNFPYSFGKLFGLGLYQRYRKEGQSFTEKYREVLYMTGHAGAEDVTLSAGCDIRTKDFWRSSIELIGEKVDLFEKIVKESQDR